MAHREQHGNREAKKPKKEKPQDVKPKASRWLVSEKLDAKAQAKH